MQFPNFIGGSFQTQSPLVDQERTMNWYMEVSEARGASSAGALYPTPGVTQISTKLPALTAPAAPTVTAQGVTGATIYGYQIVALLGDGSHHTEASATGSVTNGNSILSGSDFNRVTWVAVTGAYSYQVYEVIDFGPNILLTTTTALTYDHVSNAAGTVIPAPTDNTTGIAFIPTGAGRAHFVDAATGRQFFVNGTLLWEMDANVTITPRGTVAIDSNPATISSNGDGGGQLFVTSGGNGYVYDLTANTLTQVSALNGKATMGDQLDGYFLALDANTGTVYISDLLDGSTWSTGTAFFQRNSAADPWIAMKVEAGLIFLLGAETGDTYYNAGESPVPFIPTSTGIISYGIAAAFSLEVADGALYWLGRTVNGRGMVLKATGSRPEVVSNRALEYTFSQYGSVSDAIGDTYTMDGHTFYILTFPTAGVTWCFDPTVPLPMAWHERGTWLSEDNDFDAWRPLYHAFAFNEHRMLDRSGGGVYVLSASSGTDVDSLEIRRMRRSPALVKENLRLFYPCFELGLEPGLGLQSGQGSSPLVMMRQSNDGGKTWGNERQHSGGLVGQYGKRVRWLACGSARRRVFEITVTDPIPWRLMDAWLPDFENANRKAA